MEKKSASPTQMLDFFSLKKDSHSETAPPDSGPCTSAFPPLRNSIDHHRRSFNGIHGVISKINPHLLKSVMASGAMAVAPTMSSSVPVYVPFQRSSGGIESSEVTAPLTIFYNGTVTVFDVPGRKVGDILKLAVSGGRSAQMDRPDTAGAIPSGKKRKFLGTLTRDLPMARRISLHRFLEKRKERLSSTSSYSCK